MNYHFNWIKFSDIVTTSSENKSTIIKIQQWIHTNQPDIGGIDTETDGLNIGVSKAFLLVVGFASTQAKQGITVCIDLRLPAFENYAIILLQELYKMKKVVGWNTKFDLHMMRNFSPRTDMSSLPNLTDALIYVRLAADAISKEEGGVPMKLKEYSTRYIDPNAKFHEKQIKAFITNKKKDLSIATINLLKTSGFTPQDCKVNLPSGWTRAWLTSITDDVLFSVNDIPQTSIQQIITNYLEEYEKCSRYDLIPLDIILPYAHYDVIFTIEAYFRNQSVALVRGQQRTIELEEQVLLPLYRMEMVGFKFDRAYALQSKEVIKTYLAKCKQELKDYVNRDFSATQSKVLVQMLNDNGIETNTSSFNAVKILINQMKSKGEDTSYVEELMSRCKEIRTLTKWLSTYIHKLLKDDKNGMIYTQINQCGAVSGRVSSDFQQFPSSSLKDRDGNVLFIPRRMFQVHGGDFPFIYYLDYAAEELRFQALYTVLVSGGDRNFCRAFVPFQCTREDGVEFDFSNLEHTRKYDNHKWFLNEDKTKLWTPTDLHATTATNAFPEEDISTDYFKNTLRKKYGKPTNFACTYGANINTLIRQFGYTPELATRLYNGYYKAYPDVGKYADWVDKSARRDGFLTNLFGRRYYKVSGHKGRNYLIQGSSADFIKFKIIEIDNYIREHNLKSRMQMTIHDENSFVIHQDETQHIPFFKEIMEQFDASKIPIIADVEITTTTWDRKEDITI